MAYMVKRCWWCGALIETAEDLICNEKRNKYFKVYCKYCNTERFIK